MVFQILLCGECYENVCNCPSFEVSTQPLTEMSVRNLPGGKGRPARKAVNPTAVSRLSRRDGSLDVSQPCGPPRPIAGIASRYSPM
jgi:hypothetical protein